MKKIMILPFLAIALMSCNSNKPNTVETKYGQNKFITEDGTCYVKSAGNDHLFSLVLLKANGTGSASRYCDNVQSSWEFSFVIKDEKELYFPWFDGETMHFEFSINETTNLREIKYIGYVWSEFVGEY